MDTSKGDDAYKKIVLLDSTKIMTNKTFYINLNKGGDAYKEIGKFSK